MEVIKFNFAEVPEETRRSIGVATCDLLEDILASPGGREILDKKIAELRERRMQNSAVTVNKK